MATVTLKGDAIKTAGDLPAVGSKALGFTLVETDLSDTTLDDFSGQRLVLNIFPSVDTGTCAASVRKFNAMASSLDNTRVLCVSKDLPFAMARFCGAEGLERVVNGSAFRSNFGQDYGVEFVTGPLVGLLSRAVVVIDTDGSVLYVEQVAEIVDEPNYDAALAVLG